MEEIDVSKISFLFGESKKELYAYYGMPIFYDGLFGFSSNIIKIKLTPEGVLETTFKFVKSSNAVYLSYPSQPVPDSIWIFKEYLIAKDGKIVFSHRKQAKHTPSKTKHIPEKIEWEE